MAAVETKYPPPVAPKKPRGVGDKRQKVKDLCETVINHSR